MCDKKERNIGLLGHEFIVDNSSRTRDIEDRNKVGSTENGVKMDEGKLRMDLIPAEVERALAEVLTFGSKKYNDRNWERGIKYNRVYGSLRRHLNAWMMGDVIDEESELPHINHALCCIAFLVTYEERRMGDRWNNLTYKGTKEGNIL